MDPKLHIAQDAFAVTPSNTANFTHPARGLWIGTGGNVAVVFASGNARTFLNVPDGTLLPVEAVRVNSTNTTASNILGLL